MFAETDAYIRDIRQHQRPYALYTGGALQFPLPRYQ